MASSMQYSLFRCVPKIESTFSFGSDDCENSVDSIDCESKGFIIHIVSMWFFNKNTRSQNYVSTTQSVDTKNPLNKCITLLILNTYANEYYGSTAQKWKCLILPERSGTADDWHASILMARTGDKQDLLKWLDIRFFQIRTYGNSGVK